MFKILALTIVTITTLSCQVLFEPPTQRINHVVFCWLKEPGNKVQKAQLIQVSKSFKKIPGVLEVRAGEMVPSERKVVDSSYDVAIFLSFETEKDLQTYLDHPDHVAAVNQILKPLTSKILVYDFLEKL